MSIILLGSKGQLGSELKKKLNSINKKTFYYDHSNLDITNFKNIKKEFKKVNPKIIINCSAYTDVDGCEKNPRYAFKVNALGPKYLAIISNITDSKLIHISTDYVFDGNTNNPYKEYNIVNPIDIYGKSKLMGEKFVKNFSNKYFIFRTAWLYGEGNNFVNTMINLSDDKNKLDVISDQFGSPTSTKGNIKFN